jgi:carbon monoxide dehydrogenase subunit G
MDMSGEYLIQAPRETVWRALNDPAVLKDCIPGCEELTKVSDTEFAAKVRAKIGAVSARFTGSVTLGDIVPGEGYTIAGQGQGGPAGLAKGEARVRLASEGDATRLSYTARAQVSGKLASVGSRLMQSAAKKMADDFFGAFAIRLGGVATPPPGDLPAIGAATAAEAPSTAERPAPPVSPRRRGIPPWAWPSAVVTVAVILLILWALS